MSSPAKTLSFLLGAAAALGVVCAAPPALANGRYPAAGQIAVHPVNSDHILIRATYGVLITHDGGASWSWICEAAIGYGGFDDPMMAITADGSIIAGLFAGLSATHDGGCAWELAGGGLLQHNVVDLAMERADPSHAVLLTSSIFDDDDIVTQVWGSMDHGRTWTRALADLPKTFLGVTLDGAPSDPEQIYVSGRFNTPPFQGILYRSLDRGATWAYHPVPGSDDQHLPYIGAIDPADAGIVYVRVDGASDDALLVTKDGGATWQEAFHAASLLGLALSPDGTKIAVGSDMDGLWIAPTATLEFKQVSSLGVRCLTWTAAGLFACAEESTDGFTAGVSTDDGHTFSPLMNVEAICGTPTACSSSSATRKACASLWPTIALSIGQGEPCGVTPSADASASSGGAGATSEGGVTHGGCACNAVVTRPEASLRLAWMAVPGLLRARRRRARR
jgi:hypothetical protein